YLQGIVGTAKEEHSKFESYLDILVDGSESFKQVLHMYRENVSATNELENDYLSVLEVWEKSEAVKKNNAAFSNLWERCGTHAQEQIVTLLSNYDKVYNYLYNTTENNDLQNVLQKHLHQDEWYRFSKNMTCFSEHYTYLDINNAEDVRKT